MLIYRLEHKDSGDGIWWHKQDNYDYEDMKSSESYWDICRRCNDQNHPNVDEDFEVKAGFIYDNYWKCATFSLDHFYAWFEFDWIGLIDYGFRAYEIEINNRDTLSGKAQICFNPEAVISKREISPEEYKEYFK